MSIYDIEAILNEDHDKIPEASPIEMFLDWFIEDLKQENKKGIITIKSADLYEQYINWCHMLDADEYIVEHLTFSMKLMRLKHEGIFTKVKKIKGKPYRTINFDMDKIDGGRAEEALSRYRAQRTARAKGVEKA
jgi:hypothetical protein